MDRGGDLPHGQAPIELGVRLGFTGIDGEMAVAFDLEEPAKAGVADERLVALFRLLLELGEDGGAVGRVLCGPLVVATRM
jgi:hypothetical protein